MTADVTLDRVQLETTRLKLRPLLQSDEVDVAALPFTHPEIRDRVLSRLRAGESEQEWNRYGHGSFAVLERISQTFLGRVGLIYRAQFEETELSWILRTEAQGHGYATEAAAALLDWGLRTFDMPYVTAMIRPDNTPSIRVAERLGLTFLRTDELFEESIIVYYVGR